jgi:hypothetical protein
LMTGTFPLIDVIRPVYINNPESICIQPRQGEATVGTHAHEGVRCPDFLKEYSFVPRHSFGSAQTYYAQLLRKRIG